jgi:hypothetical protein
MLAGTLSHQPFTDSLSKNTVTARELGTHTPSMRRDEHHGLLNATLDVQSLTNEMIGAFVVAFLFGLMALIAAASMWFLETR